MHRSLFGAAFALAVGLAGSGAADAASITLTAVISDRGIDSFPRDGTFGVFGNDTVTQVTTPPLGDLSSEERTAIEFLLDPALTGTFIDSVSLLLSPQASASNLGLSSGEIGEVHGYVGDGQILEADLILSNVVATIVGPTLNGQVSTPIPTQWLDLVDSSAPYMGFMFKGVDGVTPVLFNFAGTGSGIPLGSRPTLAIEYHEPGEMPVVPEPGTLTLLGTGVAAMVLRRRRRSER